LIFLFIIFLAVDFAYLGGGAKHFIYNLVVLAVTGLQIWPLKLISSPCLV
jgi:hypothetical protein